MASPIFYLFTLLILYKIFKVFQEFCTFSFFFLKCYPLDLTLSEKLIILDHFPLFQLFVLLQLLLHKKLS